jgi:hypothetical protein
VIYDILIFIGKYITQKREERGERRCATTCSTSVNENATVISFFDLRAITTPTTVQLLSICISRPIEVEPSA